MVNVQSVLNKVKCLFIFQLEHRPGEPHPLHSALFFFLLLKLLFFIIVADNYHNKRQDVNEAKYDNQKKNYQRNIR